MGRCFIAIEPVCTVRWVRRRGLIRVLSGIAGDVSEFRSARNRVSCLGDGGSCLRVESRMVTN